MLTICVDGQVNLFFHFILSPLFKVQSLTSINRVGLGLCKLTAHAVSVASKCSMWYWTSYGDKAKHVDWVNECLQCTNPLEKWIYTGFKPSLSLSLSLWEGIVCLTNPSYTTNTNTYTNILMFYQYLTLGCSCPWDEHYGATRFKNVKIPTPTPCPICLSQNTNTYITWTNLGNKWVHIFFYLNKFGKAPNYLYNHTHVQVMVELHIIWVIK